MKLARSIPHLPSFKFAPFAIISFFLLTNFSGILFSRTAASPIIAIPGGQLPPGIPTSGDNTLDWLIFCAGEREGVDPRFIHAVIWQESKYKADAHSHAGAQGLMQLMPATAERFGCRDAYDPEANVNAGTKYLSWLLKRFNGDVALTLAGYNAGEGSVDKYRGVPPFAETQNYVRLITSRYGKTYHPVLTPDEAKLEFHLLTGSDQSAFATD